MRARHAPGDAMERWWPVDAPARSDSRWTADHLVAGWWDPGDLPRTRLRLAGALVDELLATLPAGTVTPSTRLLELGSGVGASAQELALRTGVRPHLFEPDAVLHPGLGVLAREATVDPATAVPLDLADASMDVVWVPSCLARGGRDWAPLVAEAHRVLRPGGLLAAVHAGPGVWGWHRDDPWEEDATGLLLLDLDRPAAAGGPDAYVSRWWLQEHWGRGFELVSHRPAGVLMVHPDQGHGMSLWRRGDGPALDADAFAAVSPDEPREGAAWQRQLELARTEQRDRAVERTAALATAAARADRLEEPDAVEEEPRVRAALADLAALREEVRDLEESGWWRVGAPLRAAHERRRRGATR